MWQSYVLPHFRRNILIEHGSRGTLKNSHKKIALNKTRHAVQTRPSQRLTVLILSQSPNQRASRPPSLGTCVSCVRSFYPGALTWESN